MEDDVVEMSVDSAAAQFADMLDDDLDTITDESQPSAEADPVETPEADPEADPEEDPEADPEEDPEEDTEESQEVSDDTLVDLEIGGETYEVNFHELKAGYLRNEDYVTKVNELRQEHDAKVDELESQRDALVEELRALSVIVTSDASRYDKINWEALKQQDPEHYAKLRVEALEAKEQAQKLASRHDQVQALQRKHQELKFEVYRDQQTKLVEQLIPNIREPEVLQGLLTYGQQIGYTRDELVSMVDARQLLLLNNARLYAEGQVRRKEAAEKKVSKDLPPVNKPGQQKSQSSTDRQVVKNARQRLQKDQSVEAAAALLATFDL